MANVLESTQRHHFADCGTAIVQRHLEEQCETRRSCLGSCRKIRMQSHEARWTGQSLLSELLNCERIGLFGWCSRERWVRIRRWEEDRTWHSLFDNVAGSEQTNPSHCPASQAHNACVEGNTTPGDELASAHHHPNCAANVCASSLSFVNDCTRTPNIWMISNAVDRQNSLRGSGTGSGWEGEMTTEGPQHHAVGGAAGEFGFGFGRRRRERRGRYLLPFLRRRRKNRDTNRKVKKSDLGRGRGEGVRGGKPKPQTGHLGLGEEVAPPSPNPTSLHFFIFHFLFFFGIHFFILFFFKMLNFVSSFFHFLNYFFFICFGRGAVFFWCVCVSVVWVLVSRVVPGVGFTLCGCWFHVWLPCRPAVRRARTK